MNPFQYHRHLRRTVRYVDSHISEPIRAIDVAREVGLSPSYFSAYFCKITGTGFKDWLSAKRVASAKRLLGESDKPIYQIAEDAGFGSVSSFERVFKKLEQMSPSAYRRMQQTGAQKKTRMNSKDLPIGP